MNLSCPKHPHMWLQNPDYKRNVGYCPLCGSFYCMKSGHTVHESRDECLDE